MEEVKLVFLPLYCIAEDFLREYRALSVEDKSLFAVDFDYFSDLRPFVN